LIDGVPITDTNNRPIAIPTIESIQDVKVQANTYDAEVGRTAALFLTRCFARDRMSITARSLARRGQTDWLANDFFAKRSGLRA